MVPVGSMRVRSVEQVDIVMRGVGEFASANLPGGIYNACLRRTGSRKRRARRRVARRNHGRGRGFSGHWREGWGKDGGGSVWGGEMDILVKVRANRVVYGIPGTKLESGGSSPLALCVVP